MKLKSYILKVVKKWYSDIGILRQKQKLLVVMPVRDNAGENKSQEVVDFFESMGVKNYYSTAHEQWQNGLPEAAINPVMMLCNITGIFPPIRQIYPRGSTTPFDTLLCLTMHEHDQSESHQHVPAHMAAQTLLFSLCSRPRACILKLARLKIATFHGFVFGTILIQLSDL